MNYNIFAKIIDNSALNQWKNKVKNINKEYHYYFKWHEFWAFLYVEFNNKFFPTCIIRPEVMYSYRRLRRGGINVKEIKTYRIIECKCCKKYHPLRIKKDILPKISKKYYYSSGLDDETGYKKNE